MHNPRRIFLLSCLTLFVVFLPEGKAQNITSSGFEDFDSESQGMRFLAKRFNYYYLLRQTDRAVDVIVFDTLMKRKAVVELDFVLPNFNTFVLMGNREGFNCLYVNYDRTGQKVMQHIFLNDYMKTQGRGKSIDTLSDEWSIIKWFKSPDERRSVALFDASKKKRNDDFSYELRLYDAEGNRIKIMHFDSKTAVDLDNFILDDYGNIYMGLPQEEDAPYSIEYSKLSDTSFQKLQVTQEAVHFNKLFFHLDPIKEGLYYILDISSNMESRKTYNNRGFIYGVVNPKGEISTTLIDNETSPELDKLLEEDKAFKIRYLNPTEDNGLLIGLEEYTVEKNQVQVSSSFTRGGTYTRVETIYILGDIHFLLISPDGSITWKTTMDKRQESYNDLSAEISFGVMNKGSSITVFYNNIENKNRVLNGWTIFPDGQFQEEFFTWKNAKKDYSFLVSYGVQISRTESLIPVFSSGKMGLAKIDMN